MGRTASQEGAPSTATTTRSLRPERFPGPSQNRRRLLTFRRDDHRFPPVLDHGIGLCLGGDPRSVVRRHPDEAKRVDGRHAGKGGFAASKRERLPGFVPGDRDRGIGALLVGVAVTGVFIERKMSVGPAVDPELETGTGCRNRDRLKRRLKQAVTEVVQIGSGVFSGFLPWIGLMQYPQSAIHDTAGGGLPGWGRNLRSHFPTSGAAGRKTCAWVLQASGAIFAGT